MNLRDGTKKMSKSDVSDYSRIMLSDTADEIIQKIRKAKTDPHPLPVNIKEAHKRPEAFNLLSIFASLNNKSTESVVEQYAGKEFSSFKKDLADVIVDKIDPIGKEMKKLIKDKSNLDEIMRKGKEKAIYAADSVLSKVYDVVGFSKT